MIRDHVAFYFLTRVAVCFERLDLNDSLNRLAVSIIVAS